METKFTSDVHAYANRLTWQRTSPAPFESGWSIFSKLSALNALTPVQIATKIALPGCDKEHKAHLFFRDSHWIDFERLGLFLGVDPDRLRLGFLDTWGEIDTSSGSGIKHCHECLAKGYHNVFFELAFVDTCPWHNRKLEACQVCLSTIHKTGLKHTEYTSNGSTWLKWHSACSHISIDDMSIGRTNSLNTDESSKIEEVSQLFCYWWQRVKAQPEIYRFLASYGYGRDGEEFVEIFINAAEAVAGRCPWPLNYVKYPIRSVTWNNDDLVSEKYDFLSHTALRASSWGQTYRSVRKYLYNRYVKPHKVCWNELTNMQLSDLHSLDGDTMCYVSLTYAIWRLVNENALVLEALKVAELGQFPITLVSLPEADFKLSDKAYASLLYGQFFIIWLKLLTLPKNKVAIHRGAYYEKDYFPVIREGKKWQLLLPSPQYLIKKSNADCLIRNKKYSSMYFYRPSNRWFDDMNNYYSISNEIFFKIYWYPNRGRFFYIHF